MPTQALTSADQQTFTRRFRIPALSCALALLLCELLTHPFAEMGICDDWSYILTTQKLAATGHIVYNAWATAMLGWQLYLGAAFVRLFGPSMTSIRMSTLLVAMLTAFLIQRTLVRSGVSERNATLGTLTLVLSPLYMLLSVTFMTDIQGLFAIVLCLYSCLRALQSPTPRSSFAWLAFAVASNVLLGSARQIAWLGVLVMIPSTLLLLHREYRLPSRLLFAAIAATLAGDLCVFACLRWFQHQPYSIPEHLFATGFPPITILDALLRAFLDLTFLILPITVLFLAVLRKNSPRALAFIAFASLIYAFMVIRSHHQHPNLLLEPTMGDWVSIYGIFEAPWLKGEPPLFLHRSTQAILTTLSIGGLLCILSTLTRPRQPSTLTPQAAPTWNHLAILLGPFTLAYTLLLVPRAANLGAIVDRYALALLLFLLLCLLRCYQERLQPQIPLAAVPLIALFALYAMASTHNQFAFYRARIALAAELRAANIPDTAVDAGWESNASVELKYAGHINDSRIQIPAHAFIPHPKPPTDTCGMWLYDNFPHIQPLYAISFAPNACAGPTTIPPITFSRWPSPTPGTLYVVHYTQPTTPKP
jgi:hypothetical protein